MLVGIPDGIYMVIKAPKMSISLNYIYMGSFLIMMHGLVDADYLRANIGINGSASNIQVITSRAFHS
jgi:hypothetical protein